MARKFFSIVLIVLLIGSITTFAISQNTTTSKDDLYAQIELFSWALTTIQSEYVDEKTPQDLIFGALRGMLSSLDPHSQFLDPEEYKELKTETQGKFGGLGIEISVRDGLLTIITPIEDTPAWEAGLKAGDLIVKIEGESTKDLSLNDAVKLLRGDPGTDITITILREEDFMIQDFTLTREIIQITDVKNTQILEDGIGYIRLTEFREDSHKEFRKALDQLKEDGADSLVLDLRNNPGGLLNVAIDISEEFIPAGQLIVSTKGRRASQNTEALSKDTPGKILDWPIAVLINEGSASGSEILAGALKDHQRAVIVGTTSFGKGSVQSVIPLPDGSGIRLTTSKYFTPSGVSIHGTGITPDVIVKRIYPEEKDDEEDNKKKDADKIFEDIEAKESVHPETLEQENKEKEIHEKLLSDNQIQTAISVLKGIKVYTRPMPIPQTAEPPAAQVLGGETGNTGSKETGENMPAGTMTE